MFIFCYTFILSCISVVFRFRRCYGGVMGRCKAFVLDTLFSGLQFNNIGLQFHAWIITALVVHVVRIVTYAGVFLPMQPHLAGFFAVLC